MLKNQENVYNNYKKYKTTKTKKDYKSLCSFSEIKLNNVQQFLGEYVKKQNRILLFHGIGSGKTMTIIHMCESAELYDKVWIVTQASLINSFYEEIMKYDLITKQYQYITKEQYEKIQYFEKKKQEQNLVYSDKKIYKLTIKSIYTKIHQKYRLFSYERFCKINRFDMTENQILVIDEVQNVIGLNNNRYYQILKDLKKSEEYCKRWNCGKVGIILSSGTPVYDNYVDFFLTLNLLTPSDTFDYKFFTNRNNTESDKVDYLKKIIKFINEHVSYYEPANDDNIMYPKRKFILEKCEMSDYQYNKYLETLPVEVKGKKFKSLSLSSSFFIGPRLVSNFAFSDLNDKNRIKKKYFETNELKQRSCKFYKLIKNIKQNKKNKIIIYSNFINDYGLTLIKKLLEYYGFENYKDVYEPGGLKRGYKNPKDYTLYAAFTGTESDDYRNEIKNFFNAPENKDGKNLKIMLISPAGKEGLTLLGVREIHILEPYWNKSRIQQIEGRGFRSCSHKFLPASDRNIKTFLYLAVIKNPNSQHKMEQNKKIKKSEYIKNVKSVDEYIYLMSLKKEKLNEEFNNLLKLNSLDCQLFKSANGIEKCQKKELVLN